MNRTVNTWIVLLAIAAMFAGVWCLKPTLPTFGFSSFEPAYDEPLEPPAPVEPEHSELIENPYFHEPKK